LVKADNPTLSAAFADNSTRIAQDIITRVSHTIAIRLGRSGVLEVSGVASFCAGWRVNHPNGDDGIFAGWNWDGHILEAFVDRLGMFPLYYGELPGGVVVSTHAAAVIEAGVPRDIDVVALQILCSLGFQVGIDTIFKSVKRFPVGGRLKWTAGQLTVQANVPVPTMIGLSRASARGHYLDLFGESIRRRTVEGTPVRLPLSGGRDSRHILLELNRQGIRPESCYTSSNLRMKEDAAVARELCEKLSVPHLLSGLSHDLVATELEKNERLSYEAFEHAWVWKLAQDMGSPFAVSYDGIAGDVLSAGHFHNDEKSRLYREHKFDELAERLAPSHTMLKYPLAPDDSRDAAYQRIISEMLRYRGTHNPMMFFYLYNRSRRAVSPTMCNLYGSTMGKVFAPFLDRSVFDFLTGLPEEMFADKAFHTEAIAIRFPSFSSIRYAQKSSMSHVHGRKYVLEGLKFGCWAPKTAFVQRHYEIGRLIRAGFASKYRPGAPGLFARMVFLVQIGSFSPRA
jgi:asparagine synthase (glutamine-hydrolysing)